VKFVVTTLLAAVVLVAACSSAATPAGSLPTQLNVVTTTTVFADMVRNVGGDLVAVHSLVPNGGDVHTFDAKPSDAVALSRADVVFMNGLGLDDWLVDLVQSAGKSELPVVKLGEDLPGVEYIANDPSEMNGGADPYNPHLWMDVSYARKYVDMIRAELGRLDPAHVADFDANAKAYDDKLAALDEYVREQYATVPEASRNLVAFHNAFPYYAREYGLNIIGVVVSAPGQDPSAGDTADLIDAIKAAHVKLILSEVQFPDTLVRQIASETGATVQSDLLDDALTDTVASYDEMIRTDTDKIVEGLR
jgi:manganese/iron transport system substrate-binding protein